MAMSLKKIGAMAIGGAMVASALASGAMAAATTSGDVAGFMKNAVKDGQPNVDVVVGSNAAAMDVVSAADVAAKIGSMCYKTGAVEDGSADLTIHAKSDSNDVQFKGPGKKINLDKGAAAPAVSDETLITAADDDYASDFAAAAGPNLATDLKLDNVNKMSLRNLPTLMKIDDIDPDDWRAANNDGDAGEVILAELDDKDNTAGSYNYAVLKNKAIYMSLEYADGATAFKTSTIQMQPGDRIPFLGEEDTVVKLDDNDDTIYLGKEAYDGVLKQGESYDVGNGYSVKINSVLKSTKTNGPTKVEVQILKDGKVVKSDFKAAPCQLVYGDVGVVVNKAYQDVGANYGYADLVITKDTKALKLGKEYMPNWKAYAVYRDSSNSGTDPKNLPGAPTNDIYLSDKVDTNAGDDILCGVALKYTGDDVDNLDDGSKVDIANYINLVIDDEDKTGKLYAYYSMDKSIDSTLNVGQKVKALNADVTLNDLKANAQQAVPVTAPIAKLDTEVSLDKADKNLILVGGPVVNKLTKELQDAGKVSIDNSSPATLAVVDNAANGHDVLVVAGGDRDKTREAALDLIKNY